MENEIPAAKVAWSSTKTYVLAAVSLLFGGILGAVVHGPVRPGAAAVPAVQASDTSDVQMPAQRAADPAIEKAKSAPEDFESLSQAGDASMRSGDPTSAADYYARALKAKDSPEVRVNLANALFRSGDADKSLSELAQVLKTDPKNDKALYNTGVVLLVAKHDDKGAIASWQTFLKYHPEHPHRAQVQQMIQRVKASETPAKS